MSVIDSFRLDGKVAVVTGASRGIGLALSEALSEAGADIVAVSATIAESGSEVEKRVTALGRRCAAYRCNLRDRREVYAFVKRVTADFPAIDILVGNAGTIRRKPAAEHPDEYWDEVLEVNLTAQFVLARELGAGMLARGSGSIIFTASMLSFQGGVNIVSYAASKGGIARLVMALSNEWAGKGVNVNAIAPGYIATDNTRPLIEDPARNAQILARIPAGRWGEPADLKGAVVFLASPAARYVHGTILAVDGGWLGR